MNQHFGIALAFFVALPLAGCGFAVEKSSKTMGSVANDPVVKILREEFAKAAVPTAAQIDTERVHDCLQHSLEANDFNPVAATYKFEPYLMGRVFRNTGSHSGLYTIADGHFYTTWTDTSDECRSINKDYVRITAEGKIIAETSGRLTTSGCYWVGNDDKGVSDPTATVLTYTYCQN